MDNNQTRSMEAVHTFTNELFSLYDFKVPISKAKMGAITKSALKAIKFYKHVVQNVEKFILKCKPEYKIPGLYVIDAIVRQSRHQFGAEKDVYAPRFARNMEDTFAHLFRCSQEDKSKIIRVLNLWQKNNVFAPEVIQPLFDLANPDHPVHQNFNLQQQQQNQANDINNGNVVRESPIKEDQNAEMLNASNLQKFQYQQLMMQQQADSGTSGVTLEQMKFNKQLLEFDYGSDGDEDKTDAMQYQAASSNAIPYPFNKVLEDPNIIKQLQNIKNIDVQRYLSEMPSGNSMEMNAAPLGGITLANINTLRGPQTINLIESKDQDVEFIGDTMMSEVIPVSSRSPTPSNKHGSNKRRRSRSYSRDRDRYRGRRHSRTRSHSRSRSRSPRNRRRNSRDRERERPRDKEREKQREIEKERRRKGLPDIKKDHLSVCSTTLWVGHLSKLVQQEELSDTFGKYGDIISIDMIPPRGCAYIVMNRRQDAHKAMQQLKNHKMHNRTITISWAAGKGVKGKEWKDYFDQTLGVTYIPCSKLSQQTDFESLEEGGMYDEDTIPVWIKEKMKQVPQPVAVNKEGLIMPQFFGLPSDVSAIDTSQPPPSAQSLMPTTMPTFPLGARLLMPNVLPLGVPPPNMLGMMFPSTSADKINPALLGFPLAVQQQQQQQQQQHHQSIPSDDHMDIEMDDEHHNTPSTSKDALLQAAFYNQPPPQLGMASLLMQQNESLNDRNRNNRSHSRETDRRRRSDNNNSYNSRNSGRWSNSNDSNVRESRSGRSENNNGRSRDGGSYNNFNRRHDDQFSQPMGNSRPRNNDFNRDDYDRRQGGFSNRGGFNNQQARGSRGSFTPRSGGGRGRDGNTRGFNNNFNDRQQGFDRDSRGSRGGRNWNRDESDERRQNFRGGNRNQRWSDNQRQEEEDDNDNGWNDEENTQNSSNELPVENQKSFENSESKGNDDFQPAPQEEAPPGTDDYDQQQETASSNPPSESFNSGGNNEENSNFNESTVVENAGNTTPLCDENEAKE